MLPVLLLLLLLASFAEAQDCADGGAAAAEVLANGCPWYDGRSCCTAAEADAWDPAAQGDAYSGQNACGMLSAVCLRHVRELACLPCSPNGAAFAAGNGAARVCGFFAESMYGACRDQLFCGGFAAPFDPAACADGMADCVAFRASFPTQAAWAAHLTATGAIELDAEATTGDDGTCFAGAWTTSPGPLLLLVAVALLLA